MEVLVPRFNRRASRPLIIFLVAILSLGTFSVAYKVSRNTTVAPTAGAQPALPQTPAGQKTLLPEQPPRTASVLSTLHQDSPVPAPSQPPALTQAQTPPRRGEIYDTNSQLMIGNVQPAAAKLDSTNDHLHATTIPSSALLTTAASDVDAGKLLQAREELNDALNAGSLDETQATAVKAKISDINQTIIFGKQRFADDPYGGAYVVKPGDSLAKIAVAHDTTWELLSRINGIDPKKLRAGATIKLVQGPFFAVVDKTKFTMDMYLGGLPGEKSAMYVTTYRVGLGKDDSTPPGTWMVEPQRKLKHPTYYSPRGEGVIAADDPKNPLGGYWIGLTGTDGQAVGKESYGIHGTIDPASIGKQSSMGCIRMANDDIPLVFEMLVEGKSLVLVKG
jgi:lipoprotein-anchoring transpeptidase ErfK/SrfK